MAKTFSFDVILANHDRITEEMVETIFAAGCDDSTPASSEGVVRIGFDREADTREEAVSSAVEQLKALGFEIAGVMDIELAR